MKPFISAAAYNPSKKRRELDV